MPTNIHFLYKQQVSSLKGHKAVIITDPQVYFSIFIKYYSWYIKQEEKGKTNVNLRNSGVYNSPLHIA